MTDTIQTDIPAEPHGAVVVADLGSGVFAYRQRNDKSMLWSAGGLVTTIPFTWRDFWRQADGSAVIYRPEDTTAANPHPEVTYRLPDWLGGHEVFSPTPKDNGMVRVDLVTPEGTPTVLYVWAEDLVEVRPPSIDDPAPLPLHIDEHDGNGKTLKTLTLGARESWTALDVYDHSDNTHKRIRLNVGGLRALARAAWRRSFEQEDGA